MNRRQFYLCLTLGLSTLTGLTAMRRAPLRIACLGEQTTHSLHRVNDPEFPRLLGEALEPDFKADTTPNPVEGGFYTGHGSHYLIGNFGAPNGSVIDQTLPKPVSLLRSEQLTTAAVFAPDIVVLGPFGEHEAMTGLSIDHYAPDLRRLVDRIRDFASHPVVFLLLPIPPAGADTDPVYRAIRDATLAVAQDTGQPSVDLWTPFLGHAEWFKDPTHLTEDGRRQLASIVAHAIKKKR